MAESKFKQIQEDVCYKEPEEIPESDKICPTCIPNENYTPPNWRLTSAPYLDESKCLYMVKVDINIDGDVYYAADVLIEDSDINMKKINEGPYTFKTLTKSYIRPAIRRALRYYNKLETDEIVCARPPRNQGERCEPIHGVDYEQYVSTTSDLTDTVIPTRFTTVTVSSNAKEEGILNEQALELVARVEDYDYLTNAKMLTVLVGIPAYRFDAVPDAPDLGSLNTSTDKIVIKPPEFMVDIAKFNSAMNTFKSYQAYFYNQENGSLYFEESGNDFYIRFYAEERIQKFVNQLQNLMTQNGFDLKGLLDTGVDTLNIAYEIEVSFDKSNESMPFLIKNVRARKKNCPYVECSIGLDTFKQYAKENQTMMGYFANIKNISRSLSSNITPPWLDFIVENTFPQLAVNYGSSFNFEDTDSCLSNTGMKDYILNETVSLFKAIEYRYNQNRCKSPQDIEDYNTELKSILTTTGEVFNNSKKDIIEAFSEKQRQLNDLMSDANRVVSGAKSYVKGFEGKGIGDIAGDVLGDIGSGITGAAGRLPELIKSLNPCDLKANMTIAMKCIMASLTAEEAYYAILKQIISSAGEEALEIILQSLPANQQQKIREEVEKQFKDMPFPWEPGWEDGDLGGAIDRQARENIEKKQRDTFEEYKDAEWESESIQQKIDILKNKIEELSDPAYIQAKQKENNDRIQSLSAERETVNNLLSTSRPREKTLTFLRDKYINTVSASSVDLEIIGELDEEYFSLFGNIVSSEDEKVRALNEEINLVRTSVRETEKYIADVLNANIERLTEQNVILSNLISEEIKRLKEDLEEYEKKQSKEDKTVEDLEEYQNFAYMSEEEKQEMIDKQKEKTFLVKTTPEDKIQQGTLGKALGNVQKALVQAYIDEILKTATIGDLQRAIENIPGSDLLGSIISQFKCPGGAVIYPPVDSFLSTLTLDPCKGTAPRLSLPSLQEIPVNWNWLEKLGEAFLFGIKKLISSVLMALMAKAAELISTDLCKLSGNLLRGGPDGGFEGVLADLICDDPKEGDTQDSISKKALEASGARGKTPDSYKAISRVLSVSATQREIKAAMIGKADKTFLSNMSSMVKATVPEFSDVFADPSTTAIFFNRMGNLLSAEQRLAISESLTNPQDDDFPVESSICLTREEKDLWDQQRINAFQDPDLGREFVNKQDEKALNDLADAANLLLNSPEDALSNALDKAFNPKDPDCKTNQGLIPGFQDLPQNQQKAILTATEGIFKRLEKAFIDDTVEANILEFTDAPGILLEILSDKDNRNLNFHLLIKHNPFFKLFFSPFGEPELPETVGIKLKEQIDNISGEYVIDSNFQTPSFRLYYDNGKQDTLINGDKNFKGLVKIYENIEEDTRVEDEAGIISTSNNIVETPSRLEPTSIVGEASRYPRVGKMKKLLTDVYSVIPNASISNSTTREVYTDINNILFSDYMKTLIYRRGEDYSEGFKYGREGTEIVEDEDLVYVGPNGEEPYEDFYTEEDQVLGRSKTSNPRVHFLDPTLHGGTYRKPQIYIAEADHKGWLNFSKVLVPDPTGCDPKNSNFLMLDSLMKQIERNKGRIQNHELLQYDPECTTELPFDKIANSDTLSVLEGAVTATIRVYLTEFLIQTFPVFANIDLNVDRNFGNILIEHISEFMIDGLMNERSFFASTYEGYTYCLLFLEQVVQIIHRKVRNNDMESNEEIERILNLCNSVQENHLVINPTDMIKIKTSDIVDFAEQLVNRLTSEEIDLYTEEVENMVRIVEQGSGIILGKGGKFDLLSWLEGITFNRALINLDQARFASKIYSIDSVFPEIKKLLKYLIKKELDVYIEKLRDEVEPRPHVYDVSKYFIGASDVLLGKNIDAGTFDTELPIGGGVGNFPYGDILECAKANLIHPLNNVEISEQEILNAQKYGAFYLEKYMVTTQKQHSVAQLPQNVLGITSLSELKSYLNMNSFIFDQTKNISDYFGNATLTEDERDYEGTIGIKYGVRLCYIPKIDITDLPSIQANRSYSLQMNSLAGKISSYTIPIASYEQDITDMTIKELLDTDSNFNQDLKCYIDKLCETEEFTFLMHDILNIRKIPSYLMIYSHNFFLPSLGDASERNSDNAETISPKDIGKVMNDSKSEARRLFVSFYKNDDRDPPNEEEDVDFLSQIQKKTMDKLKFVDFGQFSLDIKRRLKPENPFDKDGNECQNNFGKLFKIGET